MKKLKMKKISLLVLLINLLIFNANATPPTPTLDSIYTSNYQSKDTSYKEKRYSDFELSGGNKNIKFLGNNIRVDSIKYSGLNLKPATNTNLPYNTVVIKRKSLPGISNNKQSVFFDITKNTNDSIIIKNTYVNSMEEIINSFIINRGSDNIFSNVNGQTLNNVERIDLLTDTIIVSDNTLSGFLIMERGGNDILKIKAIKKVNNNNVTQFYSPLVSNLISNWKSTGVNINSMVFMKDNLNQNFRPNQFINTQGIFGLFFSLESLGVNIGDTIYGVSIFPGDVTSSMNLLTLSNVPQNTDAGSNSTGGLDFMSGGGFFSFKDALSVLPIELSYFKGNKESNSVNLKWETLSEKNNNYFEIERSINGLEFETLSTINGSGNSNTPLNYSYVDYNPNIGINYYRLKQVDYDGKFEYFKIISIEFGIEDDFILHPNPNNGEFTIRTDKIITILNSLGQSVKFKKDIYNIKIDYIPGIYYLISEEKSIKLIIK